jgi:hypothetical protein
MSTPPEMDAEWRKRLDPSILREVMFWAGVLWAVIAILQSVSKSASSQLGAFTACLFFIGAHDQVARKRMKALLEWIEYQKTKDKPQS